MSASVSVVVAVWDDYVELLSSSVGSVLAQDGVEADVVVVDNASTRPLPPLPYCVRVVVSDSRLSAGSARNLGLAHVRTPLVLFLDADDTLLPGALAELTELVAGNPRAVAAVGKHLLWNPASGREAIVERSPRPAVYRLARRRRLLAAVTLRFDCYPLVGCALIRTAAAREASGFGDSSLAEDWALRSALAFRGRIAFTVTPVVRVRVREGSLWHRAHSRAELEAMYAQFRSARLADPRLPWWGRLLLRPIARAHRHDARRLTATGAFRPADEGLIG